MTTMIIGSATSCSLKSIKLFTFGCTLAVVLMIFQYEHKLRLFNSPNLMLTLPSLSLISICGIGAGKLFISISHIYAYKFLLNSFRRSALSNGYDYIASNIFSRK